MMSHQTTLPKIISPEKNAPSRGERLFTARQIIFPSYFTYLRPLINQDRRKFQRVSREEQRGIEPKFRSITPFVAIL